MNLFYLGIDLLNSDILKNRRTYNQSRLQDGIFYFGLDRKIPKIPKSPGSGSGFENPEKIQSEKSRKDIWFKTIEVFNENLKYFLKILAFYGFLTIGIFSGFSENPRDF